MKETEESDSEKATLTKDTLLGLIVLLLLVGFIWWASIYIIEYYYPDLEERSLYGSSFNVISSLFSGLAFAGIIFTILLQRKELQLQRKELRETRKVLAKTAAAQEESARQFERQSNNMKMTAKLNAYNTLIDDATRVVNELKNTHSTFDRKRKDELKKSREKYLNEIKKILNAKDF